MLTFKPIIVFGNKRKDGTWAVYVRVTFKGVSRRVSTPLACTSADLTRSGRIKSGEVLDRADEIVRQLRKAAGTIAPFDLEGMDVDGILSRIRSRLAGDGFVLDFFAWADVFIQTKTPMTQDVYRTALNAFSRYLGKRSVDINGISRAMVVGFVESLDGELKASRYVSHLGHIYRKAKERYNDEDSGAIVIPRDPFGSARVRIVHIPQGQPALPVHVIQKMINAKPEKEGERFALDVFLLSFILMGVNLADLWEARPFSDDVWTFKRKKVWSRSGMIVKAKIWPEALPFIERLRGSGEWWLNGLRCCVGKRECCGKINRHLRGWCEAEGLEPFTMYAARHSWATLARSLGADKSVVDDALGHRGDYKIADIYAEKAWGLCWDACRRVLDLFVW